MNANIKRWPPALFPESDITCWGFFPFVSRILWATQVCSQQRQQDFTAGMCFWGGVSQPVVGTGVTRVEATGSSCMQRRKGTPSERELAGRAPLGRAISQELASHQLMHPEPGS